MTARRPRSGPAASGRTLRTRAARPAVTGTAGRGFAFDKERLANLHPLLLVLAFHHDGPVQLTAHGVVTFYRQD
jgi:hypothetical protein